MDFPISDYCAAATNAAHSANIDEKVHKPQSKSYRRISANMQLFLHISYEFEYLYQFITFLGGLRDSMRPYGCIKPI
jgi:hypothetical protein